MKIKKIVVVKKSIIFFVIMLVLVSCGNNNQAKEYKKYGKQGDRIKFTSYENKIGDDMPITRSEVARTIAMCLYDIKDIEQSPKYKFKDIKDDNLYYNYINICANNGIMLGDGETFRPSDNLTLVEANELLLKINPNSSKNISIKEDNKDKEISYGLWIELLYKSLEELSDNNVFKKYGVSYNIHIVLATNHDNEELYDYIITEDGKLRASNFDLSQYRDCEIGVYEKNNEIIMVKEFITDTPTIENAYVCEYREDSIKIFTGGVYRSYKVIGDNSSVNDGAICDITIHDDSAKSININTNVERKKVRKIVDDSIMLDDKTYEFDDNFKIYGNYVDTLTFENKKDIRVGAILDFVVKDNKVLAGVFTEATYPRRMRVLINDSSFANTVHDEVVISSDKGFTIGEKNFGAGEQLKINNDNYKDIFKGDYIEITPVESGKICIESISRGNGYKPMYRGIIEIIKVENGFNIISDVTMEEYLYGVIPSEMPSSYGVDASKVQAICARTYAYKEFYKGAYERYGANVDDSTSCQVYNNIAETDISIEASESTKNKIITYNNQPVDAFFFSTSGGTTASVGDVWTSDINNFPGYSVDYLISTKQNNENIDLSEEESIDQFYKSVDIDAPEKNVEWFRWNYTLQKDELSTTINNNLVELYKKRPELILTKQNDGLYKSVPISSVGLVKDINILERGDGGNVILLEVIGTENTVHIYTELYIRTVLKPYQYITGREPIILNMVYSEMKNYSLMPSSFFTMDKKVGNEGLESITFYGGGNGHGVGLSQNGANELIKSGMSIEDVISHYYSGAEIQNIEDIR